MSKMGNHAPLMLYLGTVYEEVGKPWTTHAIYGHIEAHFKPYLAEYILLSGSLYLCWIVQHLSGFLYLLYWIVQQLSGFLIIILGSSVAVRFPVSYYIG